MTAISRTDLLFLKPEPAIKSLTGSVDVTFGDFGTLTLVDWFPSMPAGCLRGLVFKVADIDTEYERLVARGVTFQHPPEREPWATETVFTDPDGNEFVLQQA